MREGASEDAQNKTENTLVLAKYPDGMLRWSDNIELLVSVYPFVTIKSFVLHIVDLDYLGPHYSYQRMKMIKLDDLINALESEDINEIVLQTQAADLKNQPQELPGNETRKEFIEIFEKSTRNIENQ